MGLAAASVVAKNIIIKDLFYFAFPLNVCEAVPELEGALILAQTAHIRSGLRLAH